MADRAAESGPLPSCQAQYLRGKHRGQDTTVKLVLPADYLQDGARLWVRTAETEPHQEVLREESLLEIAWSADFHTLQLVCFCPRSGRYFEGQIYLPRDPGFSQHIETHVTVAPSGDATAYVPEPTVEIHTGQAGDAWITATFTSRNFGWRKLPKPDVPQRPTIPPLDNHTSETAALHEDRPSRRRVNNDLYFSNGRDPSPVGDRQQSEVVENTPPPSATMPDATQNYGSTPHEPFRLPAWPVALGVLGLALAFSALSILQCNRPRLSALMPPTDSTTIYHENSSAFNSTTLAYFKWPASDDTSWILAILRQQGTGSGAGEVNASPAPSVKSRAAGPLHIFDSSLRK